MCISWRRPKTLLAGGAGCGVCVAGQRWRGDGNGGWPCGCTLLSSTSDTGTLYSRPAPGHGPCTGTSLRGLNSTRGGVFYPTCHVGACLTRLDSGRAPCVSVSRFRCSSIESHLKLPGLKPDIPSTQHKVCSKAEEQELPKSKAGAAVEASKLAASPAQCAMTGLPDPL